jgi:hypothetical protein
MPTTSPTKARTTDKPTRTYVRYLAKDTPLEAALSGLFPYGIPATAGQAGPGARAVVIHIEIEELK